MRVDLRLGDLRGRGQVASKLMNVKIPAEVNQKIQKVSEALKASKTEVVIALLNEGLDVSGVLLKGTRGGPAKAKTRVAKRRASGKKAAAKACAASGCNNPAVAKGMCAKHYQADRRKKMKKK